MEKQKPKLLSREWRLNNLYKIVDKDGSTVIFKLNKWQRILFEKEKEIRAKKWRVWLKILKARQIWFTTYKLIDKLDKAIFYSNTNVNIVAHNREKLQEIFKRVKFTFENIPDQIKMSDWRIWQKPKPKYDNTNEYYFPDKNSTMKITLDSRSWTLTDCHISEWAFIPQFRDMLRATLPSAENADITIETTANGMNEFKDFWDWDDRFESIFFPRFVDPLYKKESPIWWKCMEELNYLQDKYDLSNDQMYWYEEKYRNDKDWTLQEYPSEPIDAFISSGRPFYDLNKLKDYPIVVWEPDQFHKGLIWYKRTRTKNAIYWIDISEWLDHWDFSTIRVRDRELKLIATYKGKCDPADLTKIVNYLWENGIEWVVAPERNNHWHTFIYASKSYKWYYKLYIPKTDADDDKDDKDGKRGRETNLVTRPMMLDEHKEMIKNGLLQMDKELKDECYTFIIKNKKPQADVNCNDDVVMADAICCQMLKTPIYRELSKDSIVVVNYDDELY